MRLNARQLTVIQLGGIICLPALLAGYWLEQHYTWAGAVAALLVGNLVLWGMALCMLKLALEKRLTTAECAKALLGPVGEMACAISYAIALIGWFAINQYALVSQTMALWGLSSQGLLYALLLLAGGVNMGIIQQGIQKMALFARISVPMMGAVMVILLSQFYTSLPVLETDWVLSGSAIWFVIHLSLGMVFDIPTYYRYANTFKDGVISLTCLFFGFIPAIELVGVLLGTSQPLGEIAWLQTDSMVLKGLYTTFIVLAGLATNNANLYSAAMNSACLIVLPFHQRVWLLGGIGILLGLFNPFLDFDSFLSLITRGMLMVGALLLGFYVKESISARLYRGTK